MIKDKIAKLTSYGSYLDCEFITAKYPSDEVHIVGDVAEYVYDLEHEVDKKDQTISELLKALELAVDELDDAKDMLRECGKNDWASLLNASVDYFRARAKQEIE